MSGTLGKVRAFRQHLFRRQQQRQGFGQVQSHAAVALANRFDAEPNNFAGSDQGIEIAGTIVADARWENFPLELGSQNRDALHRFDNIEQRVEPFAWHAYALPPKRKARERTLLDRFDFPAQARQTFAAYLLQHVRIAPLTMPTIRAEFAFQQFSLGMQGAQDRLNS